MNFTNRVYLPDGNKMYVSDDQAGDNRLIELYQEYGNLKVETCHKVLGKSLDDLKVVTTGTIKSVYIG